MVSNFMYVTEIKVSSRVSDIDRADSKTFLLRRWDLPFQLSYHSDTEGHIHV